MKTIAIKRMLWTMPAIVGILLCGMMPASHAADPAKPDKPARAPRPKSKIETGSIALADATQVKVTTKDGDVTASLLPTTAYWRVQESVPVADLKTGDMVRFALRGTDGLPTVQSIAPFSLKFGDVATLTLNDTSKLKFDRVTKIAATDLAVGQNARLVDSIYDDGKIEAREVWVTVPVVK